jgi:hypothetical protein
MISHKEGKLALPKSINVLGLRYDVVRRDVDDEMGHVDVKRCEICVGRSLRGRRAREVLVHEVIHAVLEQLGRYGEYEDEQLVQGLAAGITSAFPEVGRVHD